MTYQLTPAQQAGILAADAACREHGIPRYYDLVWSLAALTVALRDGGDTAAALKRAAATLEGLRNETAAPKKSTDARLRAAAKRLST